MFNMNLGEFALVLLIILLFVGGKRLPNLAKSLGQSISLFKKELNKKETKEVQKKDA